MFWSLILDTNDIQSERSEKSFHISQVVLDMNSFPDGHMDFDVQLWIRQHHKNVLLAALSQHTRQVKLELAFAAGEKVKLFKTGDGHLHLSGYFIPQEDDDIDNTKTIKKKKMKQEDKVDNELESTAGKNLCDGITIRDLKLGRGKKVKKGDFVAITYINRLQSNGNIVGRTQPGNVFNFALGSEGIIQGWNIGMIGMKIGSKRQIISPPQAAFGDDGVPPMIPGGATLVSEIELQMIGNNE